MSSITGRKARLKVGPTSGGSFAVVAGLKSVNFELDAAQVDDSEFGIDWAQVIPGIKSFKVSATGNYRGTDTNGQAAILSSFMNDTDLWAEVLPDNGTTSNIGFKGQVVVTKFELAPSVDGGQTVSIELMGLGAATLI